MTTKIISSSSSLRGTIYANIADTDIHTQPFDVELTLYPNPEQPLFMVKMKEGRQEVKFMGVKFSNGLNPTRYLVEELVKKIVAKQPDEYTLLPFPRFCEKIPGNVYIHNTLVMDLTFEKLETVIARCDFRKLEESSNFEIRDALLKSWIKQILTPLRRLPPSVYKYITDNVITTFEVEPRRAYSFNREVEESTV